MQKPSITTRVVFLSLISAALLAPDRLHSQTAARPNIVLIVADDMGHADVGAYGGRIQTPHIDRLATEGIRFTQAYAGQPGAPEKQGFDEFFGYYHQIHAHQFYPEFLYRNGERVNLPGNAGFYDGRLGEGRGVGAVPAIDPETGRTRQFSHYAIVDRMTSF